MIKNIKNLTKISNTLDSKGTILGLLQYNDKYYLSSYLKDNAGRVYCSVKESILARYFNNELKLQEVFMASEDIVAPRNFRKGTIQSIKEQLAELITCGKSLFSENSDGMRNDSL